MTSEEEGTYEGNGIVPDHIDLDKLKRNQIMPGDESKYGSKRGAPQQADAYHHGGSMAAPSHQSNSCNGFNLPLDVALQENASLKIKMQEMQQQINDLRRMNDVLYQQNNDYRTQNTF